MYIYIEIFLLKSYNINKTNINNAIYTTKYIGIKVNNLQNR
jgi:hypothetical protein